MMKRYIKLFEEFITEEDPLAALGDEGGLEEPKKEDPLEVKKKEEEKKKKKEKEEHEEMVDKKQDSIEDILKNLPEVSGGLKDKILDAVEKQDRVKIHNAFLDVTYLQQSFAQNGDENKVLKLSKLKDYIEDLDRSYTTDKMM